MTPRAEDLPEYESPPVIEVALSLSFQPLEGLKQAHFGIFWGLIKSEYPETSDVENLPGVTESLELIPPSFTFQLSSSPPLPRSWFTSSDQSSVVQLQRDRLICNWRDNGSGYPRFDHVLGQFREIYDKFKSFLSMCPEVGELNFQGVELTYVNRIQSPGISEFVKTISVIQDSIKGVSEESGLDKYGAQFIVTNTGNDPVGRLYAEIVPIMGGTQIEDRVYIMNLIFRSFSKPLNDFDEIVSLFETGRDSIVRTFTELTEDKYHKIWKRTK